MSKRKSQTAVDDYINEGSIREGLLNYLALARRLVDGSEERSWALTRSPPGSA